MTTSAVYGINGYLGRSLARYLSDKGHSVIGFDIHESCLAGEYRYCQVDISEPASLESSYHECDCIFFLTGLTGTFAAFDNYSKYVQINEIGLLNLLDMLRKRSRLPRLVFPSTRLVYKGSDVPLNEDAEKEAKTVYAANKIACENYLFAYRNAFDVDCVVVRICVPYGSIVPGEYSYGTVGFFLKQAQSGKDIMLYGDGKLRRTFTHVADLCRQLMTVGTATSLRHRVYNTIGEDLSLRQVGDLVAGKYGVGVTYREWPANDFRIESGSTVFDSVRIESEFSLGLTHRMKNWICDL